MPGWLLSAGRRGLGSGRLALGIPPNLVFSERERMFANLMPTGSCITAGPSTTVAH